MLDPLRHIEECPEAGAVFFRRTLTQVRNTGGLWDEAKELYMPLGASPRESPSMDLTFPNPIDANRKGFRITFSSLQHEKTIYEYQGSQIPIIFFDELTHFSRRMFFYLVGRNRSTCGIKPYIRATTNPDASSWVRKFIDYWIGDDGLAIEERSGKLRWLCVYEDKDYWFDTKKEAEKTFPNIPPLSITFIPAKLEDNKILINKDPTYKAKLLSLSKVERERLLLGNWNIMPAAGMFFKRHYFKEVDLCPPILEMVRCWDRAATEAEIDDSNDPDWTAGVKMGKTFDGQFVIMDVERQRYSAGKVDKLILNVARQDGIDTKIKVFQDPGAAGKGEAESMVKMLSGFNVVVDKISMNKEVAARPLSSQSENGNVMILSSCRNKEFFYSELENFPDDVHDDIVDGSSGAFNELNSDNVGQFTSKFNAVNINTNVNKDIW